ncbi:MAG: lysophospholipase [Candidatus Tectomicrobia bacterium]|nr:lysophospholipase [Candidatus Tectomicrobia bacterium]
MNRSDAAAQKLSVPALVLYAGHDAFVTPDAVEPFFDRIASTDKEKYLFPDSYHLLLHDDDHDIVLEHIKAWISQQLSP